MVLEAEGATAASDRGTVARLFYTSQAAPGLSDADLQAILATARAQNAARGVTGLLLLSNGVFSQILEGEEAALRYLVGRIANDRRNHSLEILLVERAVPRVFEHWAMAYLPLDGPAGGRVRATLGLETLDDLRCLVATGREPFDALLQAIVAEMAAGEATGSTWV